MVVDPQWYPGREQALVKHTFLDSYLGALFNKMAQVGRNIVYIDGFAGPWKSVSENYDDTSFGIALRQLQGAKSQADGKVSFSAHLVEKSEESYERLKTIAAQYPDININTYQDEFYNVLPKIIESIPKDAFSFFFIDPKGWDIDFEKLGSVFHQPNSEIVVNLMYDFLNRFIDHPDERISDRLRNLVPTERWRRALSEAQGAKPAEREAKIIFAYCEAVRSAGSYSFVPSLRVRKPGHERVLYHLVYATRNAVGLEVFRRCQYQSLQTEAISQTQVKRAAREERTQQSDFNFFDEDISSDPVSTLLRNEPARASEAVLELLKSNSEGIIYHDLWPIILESFQITKSQLAREINHLRKEGKLRIPEWPSERHSVPQNGFLILPA
ncbi:three-Cys-motif partner protein TcmP [Parasphingorhabdus sp.]|uniref:three-Cys-motif partner protein TcmP n=1 Tax=Parasphingorhabdus sp. TaxID=2709688 RepID=UPI002F943A5E